VILNVFQYFFGGSTEFDDDASLSWNILMFGLGFFILISISAYTANLAAFLTRQSFDFIGTIDEAVKAGLLICAHPALQKELEIKWPGARFVWSMAGFNGGRCIIVQD
jgi:hypothetical protein